MLTRGLRVRSAQTKRVAAPVVQKAASHDHHVAHHVDLKPIERPAVKTSDLLGYMHHDQLFAASSPLRSHKKVDAELASAEYFPQADWTEQVLTNADVMECIAEFSATEYRVDVADLSARSLRAKYREQYANFVLNRAPAMAKSGVSKAILDKLREVYKLRALVGEEEIEEALFTFADITVGQAGLGERALKMRLTDNGYEWGLWKFFEARLPGTGDKTTVHFLDTDQYQGKHLLRNEEQAAQNVAMYRGSRAFMQAVDRGLTDEERAKVKAIILRSPLADTLEEAARAEVDKLVAEVLALPRGNKSENDAAASRFQSLYDSFGNSDGGARQSYFFTNVMLGLAPAPSAVADSDYKSHHDDVVFEKGVDYFGSSAEAAAERARLKESFLKQVEEAHQAASKGSADAKNVSQSLYNAVQHLMQPTVQADLELMHLLETTRISDKKLREIASVFPASNDNVSDAVLNDVFNPHPIAQKLFGKRIEILCHDTVQYTGEFYAGNETIWPREGAHPRPEITSAVTDELAGVRVVGNKFNTPMDEFMHLKLIRLADDFMGLNLGSDDGALAFENFTHVYDISPGEATLERVLTSPAMHHTFSELPIIKFDGWEEADELPEGVVIPEKAGHH